MITATYESDFYLWTQQQAALVRQGEFNRVDLDWANIAEEIESMGRGQTHSLGSYLHNVILHLLKWQYQPERQGTSWQLSIVNGRYQIQRLLKDSPSLKPKVVSLLVDEYHQARHVAALETSLPLATFPEECPFTSEQVTGDFWPG